LRVDRAAAVLDQSIGPYARAADICHLAELDRAFDASRRDFTGAPGDQAQSEEGDSSFHEPFRARERLTLR
jgi:hypothetical protein